MRWQVVIIESERGWGQKVDEIKYWPENEGPEAREFVTEYNSKNNEPTVPDWYMYAQNPTLVEDD